MPRTPVVIGGNGYVGRHVCQMLTESGVDFAATTRGEARELKEAFPQADIIGRFNLADPTTFEMVSNFSSFIMLASASVPSTFADSLHDEAVHNLLPFIDFFDSIPEGSRVIFVSSGGAVYGDSGAHVGPIDETVTPASISPYGLVKGFIEETLRYHARRRGIRFMILRPSNPIGPEVMLPGGEVRRRPQGVVTIFLRRMLAGEPITVYGDGTSERDYFDVRDLARAIRDVNAMPELACDTVNVGMGEGIELGALIDRIAAVAGSDAGVDLQPARGFDVQRIVLDTSRLRALTGWTPTISLDQSIRDTLDWLRS